MAGRGRKRSRRVRILAIFGLVIVVAVAAFLVYRAVRGDGEGEVTYTTETAERVTLTSSVSGIGNVSLADTVSVDPGIGGEVTGLTVEVGDTVEKGQLLFKIVNEELDLAVTDAENSLIQASDTLTRAQLAVLEAEEDLADLLEQYEDQSTSSGSSNSGSSSSTPSSSTPTTTSMPIPTSTTIESTTTTTGLTTSTAAPSTTTTLPVTTTTLPVTTTTGPCAAGDCLGVLLPLAAASTESGATVESDGSGVVLTAQAVSSGTSSSESSNITELDLDVAEQELASAQTSVKVAETKVRSAELALEAAQENAAKRSVTAPISGTITSLGIENGDEIGGSGDASSSSNLSGQSSSSSSTSSSGTDTMSITNLDYYEINMTLSEADIHLVELGQRATITVDALPDLTLTGKVIWVDVAGTNNQGVVTYEVIVAPDVTDPSAKGGMTASVNIITEVVNDVLAVPNSAVKSDSMGGKYVQVLENDQPVAVTVEAGSSNDSYTEIVSGLDEGEEVVTQTVTSQTDSAAQSSGNSLLQGTGMPTSGGGMRPGGF